MRNEHIEEAAVAICEEYGKALPGSTASEILEIAGQNVRTAMEMLKSGRERQSRNRLLYALEKTKQHIGDGPVTDAIKKAILSGCE
jgi:hypothetical protein